MLAPVLLTAVALSGWSDSTGRVRCDVPEGYAQSDGWTYTRGDGLRRVVFLPVRAVDYPSSQRARELLEKAGASAVQLEGEVATGVLRGVPDVAASLAISRVDGALWPGVLIIGPLAAPLRADALQVLAGCRAGAPLIDAGRVWDETHRVSCPIPAGATALEVRGGGAVQGSGWVLRLIAVQPKTAAPLSEVAAQWLAPSGAKPTGGGPMTSAGGLQAASVSGTFTRDGVEYFGEMVAVDLGDFVGGFGLSSNGSGRAQANEVLKAMLDTMSFAAAASPSPPPPPPPPLP